MNKRIIIGTLASVSLLALPVAVQARRGADDVTGGVRQEDRQADRQEDKKAVVPTTTGTTNAITNTPASRVLSQTSSTDTTPTPATEAAITLEEAIAKAKALFADKTVAKTETEQEHGKTVYEIKFTDGSEVEIDAATGEVIESKDSTLASENSGHGNSHDNEAEENHSGSSHN